MIRARATVLLLVLMTAGCGKPALVPATGVVTVGGNPAAEVRVFFWPDPAPSQTPPSRLGTAITDAEGKFRIACADGEGIEAGSYRVTFSRYTAGSRIVKASERVEGSTEGIPMPYSNHESPASSPATAAVNGSTEFRFDLPTR